MSVFRSLLKMYIRCTMERAYSVFATSYALSMTVIASVRPSSTLVIPAPGLRRCPIVA